MCQNEIYSLNFICPWVWLANGIFNWTSAIHLPEEDVLSYLRLVREEKCKALTLKCLWLGEIGLTGRQQTASLSPFPCPTVCCLAWLTGPASTCVTWRQWTLDRARWSQVGPCAGKVGCIDVR